MCNNYVFSIILDLYMFLHISFCLSLLLWIRSHETVTHVAEVQLL